MKGKKWFIMRKSSCQIKRIRIALRQLDPSILMPFSMLHLGPHRLPRNPACSAQTSPTLSSSHATPTPRAPPRNSQTAAPTSPKAEQKHGPCSTSPQTPSARSGCTGTSSALSSPPQPHSAQTQQQTPCSSSRSPYHGVPGHQTIRKARPRHLGSNRVLARASLPQLPGRRPQRSLHRRNHRCLG